MACSWGVSISPTAILRRAPVSTTSFDGSIDSYSMRPALARRLPAILAGDYNVIPSDLDVYAPERWRDDALFRPEVRAAYRRLIDQGWIDAVRELHPGERIYTFWKYFRNALARDAGLRIDHLLLSPDLGTRLVATGVDRGFRAREKASDHAPVWIELAN